VSARPLHMFFGHQHEVNYRMFSSPDAPAPFPATPADADKALPLFLLPAVSPIYNNNPGFRIVYIDRQSGRLADFEDRFLSVASAGISSFAREYIASTTYGVTPATGWNARSLGWAMNTWVGSAPTATGLTSFCTFRQVSTSATLGASNCCQSCAAKQRCVFISPDFSSYRRCLTTPSL
jgi:hypothetical protein